MQLVFIRHAQPAWAGPDGRSTNNPGLTPLGQRQAAHLAEWLARPESPNFDEIFTSPARRTRETAKAAEDRLGVTAEVQDWLLEIGMPNAWEGQPEDEVVKVIERMRTRPRDEWWAGHPGGERFDTFHQRITGGLDAFLAGYGVTKHQDDPDHLWHVPGDAPSSIGLFAHAGTNSVVTSHLLGLTPQPWEWERFPCDHASVTVLRSRPIANGAIWALEYFSDVAHLSREDVTA